MYGDFAHSVSIVTWVVVWSANNYTVYFTESAAEY